MQQAAVLHLESRQKDHFQMLLNHVITIMLLAESYSYRKWHAGNAILVCMGLVDIILPLPKVLRYAKSQRSCDVAFGVFVAAWRDLADRVGPDMDLEALRGGFDF
jgi:acyl-CoA-dependent ceramide synthase